MKKFIAILIIVVISLPFIVAHFLKLPQEEKSKDIEVVEEKKEDLKDNLNTPNYKPKNNDFTVIDEAPPVPPDPFENVRMNEGISEAGLEYIKNKKPSVFLNRKEPEPIPILGYKPAKNGELLYETISYREEIDIELGNQIGEKRPIKLKFEPNPENLDSIESFKIIALNGQEIEFNNMTTRDNNSTSSVYIFKDTKNKGNNQIAMVYRPDKYNSPSMLFRVSHPKSGYFEGRVNVRTKKGYIYKYKPDPPGTVYGDDIMYDN